MNRLRDVITDDVVLEYVFAQKQIRRVLDAQYQRRLRVLDTHKPRGKPCLSRR